MEAFLLYKSVVKFENMNVPKIIFFHERQGKARQGKARQVKARQGKARQGKAGRQGDGTRCYSAQGAS
jgi:hypothetical protein